MADILRGNTSVSKIYRGQTELSKVYRGQTEIWTSTPAAVFDPTLGGTITPYFWYDFTDSSQMTFSSGNNITAIASKGSNTGDIAKDTSGTLTKYTSAWTAPTWEGSYTQFYGDGNIGNSSLSRRYSSDGTAGDADSVFFNSNAMSIINIYEIDFTTITGNNLFYLASIKAKNTIDETGFDEFNPLAVNTLAGISGLFTFQFLSTDINKAPTAGMHALRGDNQLGMYSYNGISPSKTGWVAQMHTHDTTGGGTFYRESNNSYTWASRVRSSAGNSIWENFTVGTRARTDTTVGPGFKLKHIIIYNSVVNSATYQLILDSYNAAFPSDNLNGVTN